jgi:hypothetical protein
VPERCFVGDDANVGRSTQASEGGSADFDVDTIVEDDSVGALSGDQLAQDWGLLKGRCAILKDNRRLPLICISRNSI